MNRVSSILLTLLFAFTLALALRTFCFTPYVVDGSSMNPTLRGGDQILILKNRLLPVAVKKNDIVVIDGNLIPRKEEPMDFFLVKRVNEEAVENGYFVTGDNAVRSLDSRCFGPVPSDSLLGKALFVYFPLNRIKLL
ncbi:MAG: signal peptidase I [Spirochaetia bacterium]|nr:signal peptidase I [Spirochaetia bacterium]